VSQVANLPESVEQWVEHFKHQMTRSSQLVRAELDEDTGSQHTENLEDGVSWERLPKQEIAIATCKIAGRHSILRGNGTFFRMISNLREPFRFTSEQTAVTLFDGDRIWIPRSEIYVLEPLERQATFQMVLWPVKEGDWISTLNGHPDDDAQ
jgi:hypothetical protein